MNPLIKLQAGLTILVVAVSCATLPEYLTLCKKNSPDFSDCLLKNTKTAIEHLKNDNGDKTLKLIGIDPIKVDVFDLEATPSLKVVLNNCEFYGFDQLEFKKVGFTDSELRIKGYADRINVLADYDIKGQILILPIEGKGRVNVTAVDADFIYTAKLNTVDKNSKQHYKIESESLQFDPERLYYQLDNLFNGDKRLGDEMNKFLNEGWKEVYDEVRETFTATLASIFGRYIAVYLEKLSIQQLLAE